MSVPPLPDGWVVWNEEPAGRVILAFRPDVFDTDSFPAACLPTLYVTDAPRRARPGTGRIETGEWRVELRLEPEIEVDAGPETSATYDDRSAALSAAADVADRFAAGQIDYAAAYQVPREAYLAELASLTGGRVDSP